MVSVILINSRKPSELIRGLESIFEQLGKPKQLYSDEESSYGQTNLLDLLMDIILTLFRH